MAWGDEPLRSKESIRRLFDEGEAFHGRHLVLIARREIEGPRMVLFVASRRVGNAVRRNRAKRALRAAYQVLAERLTESGWHLGWIARPSCAEKGMRAIETEMEDLLQRAGVHADSAEILGGGRKPQDHRT